MSGALPPPDPRLHPDRSIRKGSIGRERAPLLVIDKLVADPDALVASAASQAFTHSTRHYPGIRAPAPRAYMQLIARELRDVLREHFALDGESARFTMCHYSLVTTPAAELAAIQRIPHVDSLEGGGLATIHYLFKNAFGGTAFYRHRKTGFETLDASRATAYYQSLQDENDGPHMPPPEYINGDTALFEQIAREDGVFNRMLVYRRNSLHSGCIDPHFIPDTSPLTGRLSINSFIDIQRVRKV